MHLGEQIYKLRTEKNMSQSELADALGVSRQSISKWETNSSVPELDKLIRLSEIFGLTLDELVTGKTASPHSDEPSAAAPAEPQIIYVEKPVRTGLRPVQILGIFLLIGALVCLIPFALFGYPLVLCLPLALWGTMCLITKHPLMWCFWCASLTWWVYLLILSAKWEQAALFLIIGIALIVISLAYTIYLHRQGQIHVPIWGWALLVLALSLATLLLVVNLFPVTIGTVSHSTPAIPAPEASTVPK